MPVRSLGVQGCDLTSFLQPQLQLFCDGNREKQERLELAVVDIRRRFGNKSIVHANVLQDQQLTSFDPQYETEGFESFIYTINNTYVEEEHLNEYGKVNYGTLKPVLFEFPAYQYLRTGDVLGKCLSFKNKAGGVSC